MKDAIVVSFGRFNPPTIGHKKLLDKVVQIAKERGIEYKVFLSKTQDKKNPLSFAEKLKYIKKAFPGIKISKDKEITNPFNMLESLSKKGYKKVFLVAGSDRVDNYSNAINTYINAPERTLNLTFDLFEVVSAGERDNDSDDASGASASKAREFVKNNAFNEFKKIVPLSKSDALELFNLLKNK